MQRSGVSAKLNAQFSRTRISKWDFEEAESYLQALRARRLPVLRQALLVAAVVSYCRPFTQNEGPIEARATPQLSVGLSKLFSSAEKELHERLLTLRHQALAHSSYTRRPVGRVSGSSRGFVMARRPFDILSEQLDTKLFSTLCVKLIEHCENKLFELNRELVRREGAA